LPANARRHVLRGAGAFEAVFRNGRRFDGRYLQLISAAAASPPGRAGFVVGRKALPRAVDRNRLKRCVREMLRAARPRLEAVDLIVRLKRPLSPAEVPAAVAEAATLLAAVLR
jgi:ribonuclease P protein component